MIQTLALKPTDRLLVFAPHPDDESVATGGLLQHALAVGTRVLVVFFTDGDNNPWAQRASELRWRIGPVQRAHFGVRRRGEVRAALLELGLPLGDARFLGFPDQGITDLLLHGNEVAATALTEALQEWQPTVLVAPSLLDLHPDHSALAVMTAFALPASGVGAGLRTLVRYVVHNPRLRSRRYEGSQVLPLSAAQRQRKRAAIACHRTQLVLRGSWLFSFASQDERYYVEESPTGLAQHPVRGLVLGGGALTVRLASRSRPRAFGSRSLCLLGNGRVRSASSWSFPIAAVPRQSATRKRAVRSARRSSSARRGAAISYCRPISSPPTRRCSRRSSTGSASSTRQGGRRWARPRRPPASSRRPAPRTESPAVNWPGRTGMGVPASTVRTETPTRGCPAGTARAGRTGAAR